MDEMRAGRGCVKEMCPRMLHRGCSCPTPLSRFQDEGDRGVRQQRVTSAYSAPSTLPPTPPTFPFPVFLGTPQIRTTQEFQGRIQRGLGLRICETKGSGKMSSRLPSLQQSESMIHTPEAPDLAGTSLCTCHLHGTYFMSKVIEISPNPALLLLTMVPSSCPVQGLQSSVLTVLGQFPSILGTGPPHNQEQGKSLP